MTRNAFLATIVVLGSSLTMFTQVFAQGNSAPATNSKVETVATFPSSAGTENICQTPDGSIYVTGIDERILWKIGPTGGVEKFSSVPYMNSLLGVTPSENGFVLTAFGKTSRPPAPPDASGAAPAAPQINFSDVDPQILLIDKTGKLTAEIPGKKGQAFNGIARAGAGWYLAADSNASSLWRIDPAKKQIELWLKDDQLAPGTPPIGANGIKVHDGWVYVSVTARSAIYRVQIGPDGMPKGSLEMFAQGFRPDDFDIAKDGSIYAPSGTTMYKVSAKGEVSKFLENIPGGPAALISKDGKYVYWPTRGGKDPQRLLRAPIS